jgi:hypothetical protein
MVSIIARALTCVLPLMAAGSVLLTGTAQAHFKLLKPASWVTEDELGAPQKGGPCGPGGGDDVSPVPMSKAVSTVHAGESIMVEFEETIHHPGWFRIALVEDRSTLKDPTFPNPSDCRVDLKTVPTSPHDNVLADGLGMDSNIGGSNRKFAETVKIPDKPCEKCTLQVIQVMADQLHAPPGCIYYHCADLKIVPAGDASSAGSGAAAGAGGTAGSAASAAGSAGAKTEAGTSGAAASGAGGSVVAGASAGRLAAGATGTTTVIAGTTAGSVAGTAGTAPSAPAAQSSSACAVRTPGRDHVAVTWLEFMAVVLLLSRLRRRSAR